MKKPNKLKVSVRPYEFLLPGSKIRVTANTPLDPQSAQGGIVVRGKRGVVSLMKDGRTATWEAEKPLSPGRYQLSVATLLSKSGQSVAGGYEVPFFVVDSQARISANLCVENVVRLRVSELATQRLSLAERPAGKFIEVFKATDRKTNKPVELAFDERGLKVNKSALFQEILKNRFKKYGKLHQTLHEHLANRSDKGAVAVAIWFYSADVSQDRVKQLEKVPDTTPQEVLRFRKRIAEESQRFAGQLRKEFGRIKVNVDLVAPVVYTELMKEQISQLVKRPEVVAVFLHEKDGIDDLQDSMAIANSNDVHSLGYKGANVKVAVWEQGPDVTTKLVIQAFYDPAQTNTSNHARHTHGIIKNKEKNKPHGHAPSCKLHSANDYDLDALRWAVGDKECTVISQSFHRSSEQTSSALSFDDIYKDWLILHWPFPTILQAAGNFAAGGSNEYVNHKGYNSLAVGNHNDDATIMAGDSVFRNPDTAHDDRELPEISANGTNVTTVGLTKWGTSMAAPAVAGITALLQKASGILKLWPEGCRALLLAGANRNVQDSTWWQDVATGTDAADGTGAVDALESIRITETRRWRNASATRRGWDIGTLISGDFDGSGYSTFSYKVKVPGNFFFGPRHVKVALVWNSKVTTVNILGLFELPLSSRLNLDFDLRIYDNSGNLVAYSVSWDNSYEIAEFNATPGETYTIRIHRWSGTDSTWFSIAWTVTGGLRIAELIQELAVAMREGLRGSSASLLGNLRIGRG